MSSSSNSSSPKVASLTSKLLVAKGGANISGFTTQHAAAAAAAQARVGASAAHPTPRALASAKDGQTQLSLRLDATQLRRLRLAAAHLDLAEQGFLIAALDHYIDHIVAPLLEGHCSCLETEHKPTRQSAVAFARQKSDLQQ